MIEDLDVKKLEKTFESTIDPNLLYEEADHDDDTGNPGGQHHHHHGC